MLEKLSKIYNEQFYIEIFLASVLFIIAITTNSMITIIIYLLYFVMMLEMVRAVSSYLKEKRIKLRILIDASIILALRELIVNVVKINKEHITSFETLMSNPVNFNILIFSGVLIFLFVLRYLGILTSPDRQVNK